VVVCVGRGRRAGAPGASRARPRLRVGFSCLRGFVSFRGRVLGWLVFLALWLVAGGGQPRWRGRKGIERGYAPRERAFVGPASMSFTSVRSWRDPSTTSTPTTYTYQTGRTASRIRIRPSSCIPQPNKVKYGLSLLCWGMRSLTRYNATCSSQPKTCYYYYYKQGIACRKDTLGPLSFCFHSWVPSDFILPRLFFFFISL
jgi:hypothetical protein